VNLENADNLAAAYPGLIATTYDPRLDPAVTATAVYSYPGKVSFTVQTYITTADISKSLKKQINTLLKRTFNLVSF